MTKEKKLEKALTEEKYKCRMIKSKKSWVIKGMLFSTLLVSGMSIQTNVYADNNWTANNPESIQIEDGATSYTLKNGDTLWAVSQVTNIKVETLAEINHIDLNNGEQYSLEIGRVIYFDGNHVTILDKNGNVVADKVLDDSDKVDSSKPFAGQSSDIQKNPVTADDNGNVKTQEKTNSNQNSDGNSNSKNNVVGNSQNGNSNQSNTGNNGGQENNNKPTNPINPTLPEEKPTNPEKPVTPEVKEFTLSVVYKDTEGNILGKDADVKVEEGKQFTATAKIFEGFTLQGQPTQTVKVNADKVITFTYKKNAETPIPAEKFDVTIMHVDENGDTIADTHTIKVEDGESYTATAKTIEGYTLHGEATQTVVVSKNTTIKFVYTKNVAPVEKFDVTVTYVDENGNEIADKEVTNDIEKGQVFSATAKEITGYTLQGDTTQTITINGNTTIKFTYVKDVAPINKYNVTVEYKDTNGNILATDNPVVVEEGKQFTVSAKTIDGYTLQGEATQTIPVTGDTTLTFTYVKNEEPVIVDKTELQTLIDTVKNISKGNYTDESFTAFETNLGVAQSVLLDADATQIEVDNAKTNLQQAFDGLEEKVPEVVNYTVTVNHVTTDGTVLDTTNETIEEGKSYTANAKTFNGYTLQGNSTQAITVTGDTTLTFIYAKDAVTPPTIEVSEVEAKIASETLALINAHRNGNGLNSLRHQSQLQSASNVRSEEIVELFEHTRPNGESCDEAAYEQGYDGMVGENIYANYQPGSLEWWAENGASLAFNAWKNSPGHNATMLEKLYTEGAVGINLNQTQGGQFTKYTFYAVFMPGLQWDEWGQDNSLPKGRALVPETASVQNVTVVEENKVKEELTEAKGVEQEITVEATEETIEKSIEVPLEEVIQETSESKVQEETITEIEGTLINRDKLSEAYNLALTLEESNYSVHSWSGLIIKLADAKYVYDNPGASQLDIDNATLALQQAINNLV